MRKKALQFTKKLSLKVLYCAFSIDKMNMDDFDILDLIDIPLQEGFELY